MSNPIYTDIPVEFDKQCILSFPSGELLKRIFGVSIRIRKEACEEQNLTYETKIERHYSFEDTAWHFLIDKKELRINHQVPNLAADELAEKCWKIFYPLEILVDSNWKEKTIGNEEEIAERWEVLKKELDEQYIDEVSAWYISEFDKNVRNPILLKTIIDQDIFLSFYFSPLYRKYKPFVFSADEIVFIPIVPKTKSIQYNITQAVSEFYTTYNSINIKQKGMANDERSGEEIAMRRNFSFKQEGEAIELAYGEYTAEYDLDKETKNIQSIIGDCTLQLPHDESRSIHIEAYYLREKDHELVNEKVKK